VSNTMTRSFSDLVAVVISEFLLGGSAALRALKGLVISYEPLSAQAKTAQTALRGR
jgi:hypothetical protein